MMRQLVARLTLELKQMEVQIAKIDAMIVGKTDDHEACQRLIGIPGIGPITATAIVSAVGNGAEFRKGGGVSAWLGLTPAEYSTGGNRNSSASASVVTAICADSWCTGHEPCCSAGRNNPQV